MIITTIAVQHDGKVLAGGYTNLQGGVNPYDEMVARFQHRWKH
jgi:hypothetical protein